MNPSKLTATPWGRALEILRNGRPMHAMQTAGVIEIPHYKKLCRQRYGPSVFVLDRWLGRMGLTWLEWAKAYQQATKGDHRAHVAGSDRRRLSERKLHVVRGTQLPQRRL